jgi:predicted porin
VGYSSPALGEISVYAVKQDTDLPNQRLPNGDPSGYTLRGFGVQYSRNIGTRFNFNGSVSHVEVTPYGGTLRGRSGLNARVALTLLASERLQLTAFANRNFTNTLTSVSTYELAEGYGLTANYAASNRLRLRFGGQYSPRRFFYAVTPVGPFIGEQTQSDIFSGASYTLNRRMRLNLDAGYQRRDADLDIFDYRSFYAAVGVSVSL